MQPWGRKDKVKITYDKDIIFSFTWTVIVGSQTLVAFLETQNTARIFVGPTDHRSKA